MKKFGILLGATVLMLASCGAKGPAEISLEAYKEKANATQPGAYTKATFNYTSKTTGKAEEKGSAEFTYSATGGWTTNSNDEVVNAYADYVGLTAKEYVEELTPAILEKMVEAGYAFRFYDNLDFYTKNPDMVEHMPISDTESITMTIATEGTMHFTSDGVFSGMDSVATATYSDIPEAYKDALAQGGITEGAQITSSMSISVSYSK